MRPQELNLLMVFDAIMTERSITRAADRLAMTQPAVSNAVSRMRTAWNDELFVKDGRNIQPTVHARNLWSQIKEPLSRLSDAVDPKAFDPATAKRTFRVAVSDIAVNWAWSEMRNLIEQQATGINLHAIPYTIENAEQVLEDAKVDLVIGAGLGITPSSIRSEYLFSPCYVCVMRPGHPLAKADMSLQEFAEADHLLVSLSGDTFGFTDEVLLQHGLSRRIAMTVNHFSAIASLVESSNLISVVPTGAVYQAICMGELAATKPPIDMPPKQVSMMWHKRQDKDQGLSWLRNHMKHILVDAVERTTQSVAQYMCSEHKSNGDKVSAATH